MMAATLCGSPMYMVRKNFFLFFIIIIIISFFIDHTNNVFKVIINSANT